MRQHEALTCLRGPVSRCGLQTSLSQAVALFVGRAVTPRFADQSKQPVMVCSQRCTLRAASKVCRWKWSAVVCVRHRLRLRL